jgi:hypothetical protein
MDAASKTNHNNTHAYYGCNNTSSYCSDYFPYYIS